MRKRTLTAAATLAVVLGMAGLESGSGRSEASAAPQTAVRHELPRQELPPKIASIIPWDRSGAVVRKDAIGALSDETQDWLIEGRPAGERHSTLSPTRRSLPDELSLDE